MIKGTISILSILFILSQTALAQTLRIMPMGNSITYDENSYDTPPHIRPTGDRISYRYKLSQLITEAGYDFDFVGSEDAGNNYFQNDELDDNAGFPGINATQMAYLINTGYNQRTGLQVAPGPYLQYYPADIILLHIGTNDLAESSDPVENILANIRSYSSNVIILVARIINRETYSAMTTTFNDNVQAYIEELGDPRIFSVNMETGAGLDYWWDMYDNLHPNTSGYNKMAAKWWEAIDNLNNAPVVSEIPQQYANQGSAFNNLILDNFVTDPDDADNEITWTYKLKANTKLQANIDANRILHINSPDITWYGTDTIMLKATDTGNGAFIKSDSVKVVLTVNKNNEAPLFSSIPVTSVDEDNNYSYIMNATDNDSDPLNYFIISIPSWITYSSSVHSLTGRPTNDEVGNYPVKLAVTDGKDTTYQNFNLIVKNVNDSPVITSTPLTTAEVGVVYLYELTATDIDVNDTLVYSAVTLPAWLTLNGGGDKATLYGTPQKTNKGSNAVILSVSDGSLSVIQGFSINVEGGPNDIQDYNNLIFKIYPNPAKNKLYINTTRPGIVDFYIYDITGAIVKQLNLYSDQFLKSEIDIEDLNKGLYLFKIILNDQSYSGKLTIAD